MLENTEYNIGREYEFYATTPPGQRSKGGTEISDEKELSHKRLAIRTTLQMVAMQLRST